MSRIAITRTISRPTSEVYLETSRAYIEADLGWAQLGPCPMPAIFWLCDVPLDAGWRRDRQQADTTAPAAWDMSGRTRSVHFLDISLYFNIWLNISIDSQYFSIFQYISIYSQYFNIQLNISIYSLPSGCLWTGQCSWQWCWCMRPYLTQVALLPPLTQPRLGEHLRVSYW